MTSLFSSAPSAPNPYEVAAAQTQSNLTTADAQANLNAISQYNPYGSSTFLENANGDPYAQVSSMTPALADLLGGQEYIGGALQGTAQGLIGNLPTGGVSTDFGPETNSAEEGAFAQSMGLLNPEFNLQNQALNTTLTDRGIPVGSEAWNNATSGQQLTQDAATTSAAGAAVGAGNAEQAQLFGEGLSANQLPYQELAQTLGMSPTSGLISSAPGAVATSPTTIQPTNVSGDVYQSYADQLAAYNQQQNNLTSGLLGAATLGLSPAVGAGLGLGNSSVFGSLLSDENEKENRRPADGEDILFHLGKLDVDHYDYRDSAQHKYGVPEHRTGPMAQDWAKHFGGDGHMIDLGDMAGKMLAAIQALDARTSHLAEKRA
jgi:hypothetical protein